MHASWGRAPLRQDCACEHIGSDGCSQRASNNIACRTPALLRRFLASPTRRPAFNSPLQAGWLPALNKSRDWEDLGQDRNPLLRPESPPPTRRLRRALTEAISLILTQGCRVKCVSVIVLVRQTLLHRSIASAEVLHLPLPPAAHEVHLCFLLACFARTCWDASVNNSCRNLQGAAG